MWFKLILLLFCITFTSVTAAPSKPPPPPSPPPTTTTTPVAAVDSLKQVVQPQFITLEHFESLLRRAGELFRPIVFPAIDAVADGTAVPVPYQQMQPPVEQPYNFYFPLYDQVDTNTKLDAKSRKLESISPPPMPSSVQDQINYYAVKPKKLPKKFQASAKHINLKWLNTFEKEVLADALGELPKAVYLVNDERNRINFDDSFFGVDMQVKIPNNQPHKDTPASGDDFLNQGEEAGEEDLIAVPAAQIAQQVQLKSLSQEKEPVV